MSMLRRFDVIINEAYWAGPFSFDRDTRKVLPDAETLVTLVLSCPEQPGHPFPHPSKQYDGPTTPCPADYGHGIILGRRQSDAVRDLLPRLPGTLVTAWYRNKELYAVSFGLGAKQFCPELTSAAAPECRP